MTAEYKYIQKKIELKKTLVSETKKVELFDIINKPKRRGRPRKHSDFNTICANKLDDCSQFEIQQLLELKQRSPVSQI